jgi:hypothetical protein
MQQFRACFYRNYSFCKVISNGYLDDAFLEIVFSFYGFISFSVLRIFLNVLPNYFFKSLSFFEVSRKFTQIDCTYNCSGLAVCLQTLKNAGFDKQAP